jgi:hypothetical protein
LNVSVCYFDHRFEFEDGDGAGLTSKWRAYVPGWWMIEPRPEDQALHLVRGRLADAVDGAVVVVIHSKSLSDPRAVERWAKLIAPDDGPARGVVIWLTRGAQAPREFGSTIPSMKMLCCIPDERDPAHDQLVPRFYSDLDHLVSRLSASLRLMDALPLQRDPEGWATFWAGVPGLGGVPDLLETFELLHRAVHTPERVGPRALNALSDVAYDHGVSADLPTDEYHRQIWTALAAGDLSGYITDELPGHGLEWIATRKHLVHSFIIPELHQLVMQRGVGGLSTDQIGEVGVTWSDAIKPRVQKLLDTAPTCCDPDLGTQLELLISGPRKTGPEGPRDPLLVAAVERLKRCVAKLDDAIQQSLPAVLDETVEELRERLYRLEGLVLHGNERGV